MVAVVVTLLTVIARSRLLDNENRCFVDGTGGGGGECERSFCDLTPNENVRPAFRRKAPDRDCGGDVVTSATGLVCIG